mgnify:FL=1
MSYQLYFEPIKNNQNCQSFSLISSSDLSKKTPLSFDIIRDMNTYKKSYGKTLIIGGDEGYLGAIIISSRSALYSGSRYVEAFSTKTHANILATYQPELITSYSVEKLYKVIKDFQNILIGPGLSENKWSVDIFEKFKKHLLSNNIGQNIIADAGFLNILSSYPFKFDNWILTPHIGEAAKLLNTSTKKIQENRLEAATRLQKKFGGVVVLKGPGTIIKDNHDAYVCSHGNHGMGTAGMGDCLAGIILSMVSMVDNKDYIKSILYAVGVHSLSGDLIQSEKGTIGLLASNVMRKVNKLLNNKI